MSLQGLAKWSTWIHIVTRDRYNCYCCLTTCLSNHISDFTSHIIIPVYWIALSWSSVISILLGQSRRKIYSLIKFAVGVNYDAKSKGLVFASQYNGKWGQYSGQWNDNSLLFDPAYPVARWRLHSDFHSTAVATCAAMPPCTALKIPCYSDHLLKIRNNPHTFRVEMAS